LLWVQSQVGYREEANNWNKYAAMPNVERLYGGSIQNAPWCDLFTDAAFVTVFGLEKGAAMTYQTIGNGSALCRTSAAYFKEHGAFYATPEPGDVIFFYRNGDINHQGIVVKVDGGTVHTVEGNSSDMVAERCYSASDSGIAGYGRPKWSLVADEGDVDAPLTAVPETDVYINKENVRCYELRIPYLAKGSKGDAVRSVQILLLSHNISCGTWGADGDFGEETERAVKEFQRKRHLSEDGIVGPDTGAALYGVELSASAPADKKDEDEPKANSFWDSLIGKIRRKEDSK
jgi:hypothetical protein